MSMSLQRKLASVCLLGVTVILLIRYLIPNLVPQILDKPLTYLLFVFIVFGVFLELKLRKN